MKTLWISLLISIPLGVSVGNAQIPTNTPCGEYQFQGTLRRLDNKELRLVMYEGSISEVQFTLAPDLTELAGIYPNAAVTLKGKLSSPIKDQRGHIDSLLTDQEIKALQAKPYSERFTRDDIRERVPDPLHPELDSSLKLTKKLSCIGEVPPKGKSGKKTKK